MMEALVVGTRGPWRDGGGLGWIGGSPRRCVEVEDWDWDNKVQA